jgi:hypothetical protein
MREDRTFVHKSCARMHNAQRTECANVDCLQLLPPAIRTLHLNPFPPRLRRGHQTNQCLMHQYPAQVQLNIPLPAADYRVYVSAVRKLRRIMGRKAPDAMTLVQSNLRGRDVTGIVDDYLDSVGWPHAAGRTVSLRRPAKSTRSIPRVPARAPLLRIEPDLPTVNVRPLPDPSRN